MKRRYMTLAVLLVVSMAAVVAVGSVQKNKILKPLELDGGLDPAQVPFLLATDDDLHAQIDIARELIAEEGNSAPDGDAPTPPEDPENGGEQIPPPDDGPGEDESSQDSKDPVTPPDVGSAGSESPETGGDNHGGETTGDTDTQDPNAGTQTDVGTGEDGQEAPPEDEPPEEQPPEDEPPEEPLAVTVGTSGEFTPESTVDDSWFDDVLFIGDSRTEGLRLYSRIGGADYFAATGMSVYTALTKKASDKGFSEQTLPQLLKNKTYGKIFIGLGINECGSSFKSLTKAYTKLVNTVREAQPDAVVILQAIMTTGHKKEAQNICFGPKNLFKINEMIRSLADGEHIFYINVNEVFADEEGYLPDSFSGDGCHLYAKYYPLWVSWIKSAVVDIPLPTAPDSNLPEDATDEPVTDEPTTGEPATDEPATDEPATGEPETLSAPAPDGDPEAVTP